MTLKKTDKSLDTTSDELLLIGHKPNLSDARICFIVLFLLVPGWSFFTFGIERSITVVDANLLALVFLVPSCYLFIRLLTTMLGKGKFKPTGSLLISTSRDLLKICYGYPTPSSEKTLPLSKVDAIELAESENSDTSQVIYIRSSSELIKVPSSDGVKTCHNEAIFIAEILDKPIFKLNEDPSTVFSNIHNRLPYYTPKSTSNNLPIQLDFENRDDEIDSVLSSLSIANSHCQFCGTLIKATDTAICSECYTPHHRECFKANGRCTIYSCNSNTYYGYTSNGHSESE